MRLRSAYALVLPALLAACGDEAPAPEPATKPAAPAVAEKPVEAVPAPAPTAPEPPRRPREHAPEAAAVLAVAGSVKTAGGGPLGGATVEAFAIPKGEDVPDDERVAGKLMTRLFGAERGASMLEKGRKLRKSGGSFDDAAAGDLMQDGIEAGLAAFTDDGGADFLGDLMRAGRDAVTAPDAPWPAAGSATSGADGAFRIEGVPEGRIELRVRATGHIRTKARVNSGDAAVVVELPVGAHLAGTVTCEKQPVVGATVIAAGSPPTTTADAGRFAFDAVHVPKETLLVSAPGCVTQGRLVNVKLDAENEAKIELEPAGTIHGRVSAAGGGPIAGARISFGGGGNFFADLMGMAGSVGAEKFDVPPQPAVSGEDGTFVLECVRAGATKLRVAADGRLPAIASVEVKRREIANVDVVLVLESTLGGVVTDAKGAPVGGAKVRVEMPAKDGMTGMIANFMGGSFRSVTADESGRYLVNGLPEGERKVRVEAAKYLTFEETVKIPASAPATRDFALREGYKLAGTVVGPDGAPMAGAKVKITAAETGTPNPMTAALGLKGKRPTFSTDGEGRWSADGLQEGPYQVDASSDGFLDASVADVTAGRTDVALALRAGATIKGRVLIAADASPADGAAIRRKGGKRAGGGAPWLDMLRGDPSENADAQGVFELRGLEAGSYELTASKKGYANSAPLKVTLAAGATVEGVELLLPAGVAVSGRVIEKSTGAPVAGALVWISTSRNPFGGMSGSDIIGGEPQAPANAISTKTNADGSFVLDGLTPGKATIEARVLDHAPASAANVAVPGSAVEIAVSAGGSVEGAVTDASGRGVAGASILLMKGMGMGGNVRPVKSDGDGNYRIDHIAAGAYQMMLMDSQSGPMPTGMSSVTVKDGEVTRHDFGKKAGGKQLGGGVVRDGKPLTGAMVVLTGGPSGMRMATSDEKGAFRFDDLEPGEYTITVQSNMLGGSATSKQITIGADGKPDDVRLEFSSLVLEGTVVDAETGRGVGMAMVQLVAGTGASDSIGDLMSQARGQAISDGAGRFKIADLSAGTFSLRASADGYAQVIVDGVSAGATGLTVKLTRGADFAVTVLDGDGVAVEGAVIEVVDSAGRAATSFDMQMSRITKGDGVATFRLAPGTYTLKAHATNLLPKQVQIEASHGSVTIQLDAGAILEVLAKDADGAAVSGATVKVLDATGAEIQPGLSMGSFFGSGGTDADGRSTRAGLPAARVSVVVTDSQGRTGRRDVTLALGRNAPVEIELR